MIIIISVISTNMGKKEVNTIYSSFQLKERLNFRINLATAIEKIQAETVEQLEALQMIKMELSAKETKFLLKWMAKNDPAGGQHTNNY